MMALSCPDLLNMVGQLPVFLSILIIVLCHAQDRQCDVFKEEYCSLSKATVLMVDAKISGPAKCQSACFEKTRCTQFTFFRGDKSKCVLFKTCRKPMSSCSNCISGPAFPRIESCGTRTQQQRRRQQGRSRGGLNQPVQQQGARQTKPQSPGFCIVCILANAGAKNRAPDVEDDDSREERESDDEDESDDYSEDFPDDYSSDDFDDEPKKNDGEGGNNKDSDEDDNDKDDDKDEVKNDEEEEEMENDEEEGEDEVNIDDGLLDDVFEDLPGSDKEAPPKDNKKSPKDRKSSTRNNKRPTKPNRKSQEDENPEKDKNKGECPTCPGFYYCVMGGSNANGAISAVALLNIGTYSIPSRRLISPFPSFMTQGSGRSFSMYSSNSLLSCTPGYQVSTLDLRNGRIQSSYIPGSCNGYNFLSGQWASTGGKLTAFRNGGSTVNVGSYIMSLGGFDPFGQRLRSVELFDPRRSHIGWQNVPQWSYPRATKDQCTVETKDAELGSQVMVMGGLGEEHSVMKLVLSTNSWYSVSPMNQPRSQHGCTSVTLNGRPGVVVSGGIDNNNFNTSSVEFFDMKTSKWINLPNLSRGRRGHTMNTVDGKLVVAGGQSTGISGEEEFLDDVEVFDGRRWKRANYKLDQQRTGANLVKIPISAFVSK